MDLKHETQEKLFHMAHDPDYQAFFDLLGQKNRALPNQFIEELTHIFMADMELGGDKEERMKFLVKLAYLAGQANIQES